MKVQFSRASASASAAMSAAETGAQRIGQQVRMQPAFGLAGIGRRHQFGPRQIGHDQFGRRDQPAMIGAARQMMAGGDPEFSHVRSVFMRSVLINPSRSTCSSGVIVAFDLVKGKGAGMGVQPIGTRRRFRAA